MLIPECTFAAVQLCIALAPLRRTGRCYAYNPVFTKASSMRASTRGRRGMAVAPHALAAQSALDVLREGGNAIEAMIAAAATIAVVYPHMNSIGGDSFWLMHVPGKAPGVIDACGAAAERASIDWYRHHGIKESIPFRGGLAANTVAGTV